MPPDPGGTTAPGHPADPRSRLLVELVPGQAEAHGLLALMLHSHARTAARRSPEGRFVPLDQQDITRWDAAAITEAEHHLALALGLRQLGPYQLQAAIQSVHNRRALTGSTDWIAISTLYDGRVASYQPYWVARADALRRSGDLAAASHATTIAVGLTADPAIRQFLLAQNPERGSAR